MKPVLTRAEARAMDAHAVDDLRLPSLVLMENAGRGATESIRRHHAAALKHVVVVGGVGQNGGDAWVVARHLSLDAIRVHAFLVDDQGRGASGDAAVQLEVARRMGVSVHVVSTLDDALRTALANATLVVDGLFGTGLARPVEGTCASIVDAMNASHAVVVALDIPSGIDADSGQILGRAVDADRTVTFGAEKRGLLQGDGARHAGVVEVAGIGAPCPPGSRAYRIEDADLAHHLTPRAKDAHKGTAGHVLIVAGAAGTTGASLLTARGAARAGAGLVTIAARPSARAALDARVLESMTREFDSVEALMALAEGKRALVVGPGLGTSDAELELVHGAAFEARIPVVLDADALALLGRIGLEKLRDVEAPRVLTPHPGEAASLLGVRSAEVQLDRHGAAEELARRSGHVVVLKGAGTIIAAPCRADLVVTRGTPALGTGGTGDVLAGIVGALVSTRDPQRDAAMAAYWHAAAGEHAAATDRGLLASEVADALPSTLEHIRRSV